MAINKVHVNVMILLLSGAFMVGVLNPKVVTAQASCPTTECPCVVNMTCGPDNTPYDGCSCCGNPGCTIHLCDNSTVYCPTT
ncbi:hypothetical protein ACB094_01G121100 [Castanea mollissima]